MDASAFIDDEKPRHVSCDDDIPASMESKTKQFPTNVEQAILQDQLRIDDVKLSFLGIYNYATWLDLAVVAICAVCAIIAGALSPIAAVCSCPFPSNF